MQQQTIRQIESITGQALRQSAPLHGGMIGQVYRLTLGDDRRLVAKTAVGPAATLSIEAYMLGYLRQHSRLPVPEVVYAADELLLMEFIEGESRFGVDAERHAAELLADLHSIHAPHYGLERDTLIGGLHQPNTQNPSWLDFFREQRLLHMGQEAQRAGRLPAPVLARLETLCGRLERWLEEPERPCLIHGDVWTTNVLAQQGRITAFLDPAIYYADPEIELAFITLFSTFGRAFFEHYSRLRPLRPGFFELRRDLYNLYPLLVHVRLFGGGYVSSVEQILRRLL